jgi:hypothetical protein
MVRWSNGSAKPRLFYEDLLVLGLEASACAMIPELRADSRRRQLPDPFYANDVAVWNLAPALPFARVGPGSPSSIPSS